MPLVRAALIWALSSFLAVGAMAQEVAPVDEFPDVLDQYRRFEIPVPATFRATCTQKALIATCALSTAGTPEGFNRLLRTLKGGVVDRIEVVGRRKGGFQVKLELRPLPTAQVGFRSALLENPTRWVLEFGDERLLSDPVEDEVPFRPYPLPAGRFEPSLPEVSVRRVSDRGPAATAVNACVDAATGGRPAEAVALCESAQKTAESAEEKVATTLALGEALGALGLNGRAADLSTLAEGLAAAEKVAPTPEARARFVLLHAQSYEPMGFPNRAEVYLSEKLVAYKGTPAEPWLLAGQLRSAIDQGNTAAATALIERLKGMAGDNVNIGGAVLLGGGKAYEQRDWLRALELLETGVRQWPDLVSQSPEALFQLAELCVLFGRYADAEAYYGQYMRRFDRNRPHHVVRVRLATLSSREDPMAGRARLMDLALALKELEGQQLAAMQAVRMSVDVKDRRRILRQVERTVPTEYVAPEFFTERARVLFADGQLRPAYDAMREVWRRFPDETILRKAQQLPERLLAMLINGYVTHDRPLAALGTYYAERSRVEAHTRRPWLHLLAGRAMWRFGLAEEAAATWQRGLKPGLQPIEPDVEADLHLELAAALVQLEDKFKLREILRFLDRKYPGRYDSVTYWRAKAADARWHGNPGEARDMLVYALNGPVAGLARAELAGEVAELYAETGDVDRAVRALRTQLELMDAELDAAARAASPERRSLRWQLVEHALARDAHAEAISTLGEFLSDYPNDPRVREAQYLKARALEALGDRASAVRLFDGLVNDPAPSEYKRLAALELEQLRWHRREAPRILEEAGFTPPPEL